jgi:nitrite reductase (NADH) large subunit
MRVLVIGAGPAGTRCAERLAAAGKEVLLCGEEPCLPYDRVALGRILAGEAAQDAIVTHDAARLPALGIAYRAGERIVALDPAAGRATTARGEEIGWDRVVLATGSEAIRLALPGADLAGVFVYRRLADVLAMRRHLAPGMRVAVIGGGLLGLEAAAALAGRGARVEVVHAAAWPMERQLDAGAGALLARAIAARCGIRFLMPASVEAIEGEGAVRALRLADGTRLPAEMVVMAVGVRPNTALARQAGLACARGILVDEAMRTSAPGVLAIGECAEHGGAVCGLVAPALAMAETAAAVLAGQPAAYAARPDAAALKVAGIALFSAGEIAPPDAETITLQDPGAGLYRRLWLRDGRLVGAVLHGATADAPFFLDLIATGRPVAALRPALAFGPAFQEAA